MRKTTLIRRKVKEILETTTVADSDQIYDHYFEDNVFPYVCITIANGVVSDDYDSSIETGLSVECWIQATSSGEIIEDELDKKAELVENALKQNDTLDGLVEIMRETDFDYALDTELSTGRVTINFKIRYED